MICLSAYDARERTITWIETYDTPADITKNDDVTEADIINQFEKPPYPMKRIFFDPKNVDGIRTIGTPSSVAHEDWKHECYAYTETVPIELSCVTKQGITGDKLRWKMEADLRNSFETYPLGSVRTLDRVRAVDRDMGTWKLHTVQYDMSYKRAADDYTSDCTLSHGTGWNYDGDRVDNGIEGQWGDGATTVDVDGGSTVTQNINTNPGALTFNLTNFVGDAYSKNATNLSLSTAATAYTRIRFRYKTTGSATAKIVVGDDAAYTQTVLAETASSTWTVGDVALTADKTLDHVSLYCCDGVGTVLYDFVQIYKGNFTFPNVVELDFTPSSRNTMLSVPGRVPGIIQNMGADNASIEMLCDLDMETSTTDGVAGCWARTGDTDNGQIFLDVAHEQSDSTPWEWLVWGNKACKVTLDTPQFNYKDANMVRLSFKENSNLNTSGDSSAERWNIT